MFSPQVVSILLDMDVDIDRKNKYGHTALTWACASGHADVVRLLLFKGANIHHQTVEGRTCLHYACKYAKVKYHIHVVVLMIVLTI